MARLISIAVPTTLLLSRLCGASVAALDETPAIMRRHLPSAALARAPELVALSSAIEREDAAATLSLPTAWRRHGPSLSGSLLETSDLPLKLDDAEDQDLKDEDSKNAPVPVGVPDISKNDDNDDKALEKESSPEIPVEKKVVPVQLPNVVKEQLETDEAAVMQDDKEIKKDKIIVAKTQKNVRSTLTKAETYAKKMKTFVDRYSHEVGNWRTTRTHTDIVSKALYIEEQQLKLKTSPNTPAQRTHSDGKLVPGDGFRPGEKIPGASGLEDHKKQVKDEEEEEEHEAEDRDIVRSIRGGLSQSQSGYDEAIAPSAPTHMRDKDEDEEEEEENEAEAGAENDAEDDDGDYGSGALDEEGFETKSEAQVAIGSDGDTAGVASRAARQRGEQKRSRGAPKVMRRKN